MFAQGDSSDVTMEENPFASSSAEGEADEEELDVES